MPLARVLAEGEDELPIITMLLDDTYQQMLHAPVTPSGQPPAPARQPSASSSGGGRRGGRRGGRSQRR
jgi:hypothetical protein